MAPQVTDPDRKLDNILDDSFHRLTKLTWQWWRQCDKIKLFLKGLVNNFHAIVTQMFGNVYLLNGLLVSAYAIRECQPKKLLIM